MGGFSMSKALGAMGTRFSECRLSKAHYKLLNCGAWIYGQIQSIGLRRRETSCAKYLS